MRPASRRMLLIFAAAFLCLLRLPMHAQEDGGTSETDGGGQEVLESIFVPYLPHAPFSLTLATEWSRPMHNGGSFTVVNSRPIMRDSIGRIYMERWLLTPRGSGIRSRMSWIQIADPIAHTLYECDARQHICALRKLNDSTGARMQPSLAKSGPLASGKGSRTHEDLGPECFAGLPIQRYRDTTILNPGVLGNDLPMSTVRELSFSPELGINLSSMLDTPQLDRQTFTVTEISTAEPDPRFFSPPDGYRIVDRRSPATPQN